MDLGAFFDSLGPFDLFAFVVLLVGFVTGFIVSPIRRLLGVGIATLVTAFAINLRGPVGGWLSQYWTQDSLLYTQLLAGLISFGFLYVTATLLVQIYVKPMTLLPGRAFVNEIIGGIAGVAEAAIVLGALIILCDSYFRVLSSAPSANELPLLRTFFHGYDDSLTGSVYRNGLIPAFMSVFGWLLPAGARDLYLR